MASKLNSEHRKLFATTRTAGAVCAALLSVPALMAESLDAQFKNFEVPPTAPAGAPNVLLIMTDDVGFGASSTFGGPVPTPTLDGLAEAGVRYNSFSTTAMCSPTRAALLTGRNHHAVGFGVVAELATDHPGYDAQIPESAATIAEVLRLHGYNTAMLGKNHNTPMWERTPVGPFDRWPTGLGFDYFYGFNGGWSTQYAPELFENTTQVDPPRDNAYFFERDLADHAINWLRTQRNLNPARPFFLYYAPPTSHAPHHAPADWISQFAGQFEEGWDRMREETFSRQKSLGIIPDNARLTPRPAQIPAWDSLTADEKKVAVREMQVYAAALAYADAQIGRILASLVESGQLGNTLIFFIQGDNGASAEDLEGTINMYSSLAGRDGSYAETLPRIDELGSATTMENYPVGWAWAMNTPFQWSKLVASHFGGTRNGLVISWPGHMKGQEIVRGQFHHAVDIAPTIYEAVGVNPPPAVDGVEQEPLDGVSMLYTLMEPEAPSNHHSQYFELMGNRAWYQDGWIASTTPENMPWTHGPKPADPNGFKWELYDLTSDFSQANDLAAQQPEKLAAMKDGFQQAAETNNVFPLDASTVQRLLPGNKPSLTAGRNHFEFYPGVRYEMGMIPELIGGWSLSAEIVTDGSGPSGMVAVRGNLHNGWGLFLESGVPKFLYRTGSNAADAVRMDSPLSLEAGSHQLTVTVVRESPNPASGGEISLSVDGQTVASALVPRFGFSYGLLFVGRQAYEPLALDLSLPVEFEGAVTRVAIDTSPPVPWNSH